VAAGRGQGQMPPGASEGRRKKCGNFLRHKIYKNFVSSVEAGMGNEEHHVRRTMHILDVISSVSRSSKCTKIVGGWGFAPDPTGLPRPSS